MAKIQDISEAQISVKNPKLIEETTTLSVPAHQISQSAGQANANLGDASEAVDRLHLPRNLDSEKLPWVIERLQTTTSLPVELQAAVKCMMLCSRGIVAGLANGKLVLVHQGSDTCTFGDQQGSEESETTVREHESEVSCLAISKVGRLIVSGSTDSTVKVWSVDDNKGKGTLEGHQDAVTCVAITRDEKHAISGSADTTLKVWSLSDMTEVGTLRGHKNTVNCLSIASDGKHVLSGSADTTLKWWDLESMSKVGTLRGHSDCVLCITITSDGEHAVSGSGDNTLKVWNLSTFKENFTLAGHTGAVLCVATTGNRNRVVSGSADNTLKVWNLNDPKNPKTLAGHEDSVWCLVLTSDGRFAVSGADDTMLKMWSLDDMGEVATLRGHTRSVRSIVITPHGNHVVSASADRSIRVWNLEYNRAKLTGHNDSVTCLAITPDKKFLASGSADSTLKIWNLKEMKETATLIGHKGPVMSLAISSDGNQVVSGSADYAIEKWSLRDMTKAKTLTGHNSAVCCLAITPNNQFLVSASADNLLKVWNLDEMTEVGTLTGHQGSIVCLAMTLDGTRVVSGSDDNTLIEWSIEDQTALHTFSGHTGSVSCVALTRDGRYAVSGSTDYTLKKWDLCYLETVLTFQGHLGRVSAVVITSDQKHVVSASFDKTLKVWLLNDATELVTLEAHKQAVSCLAMSLDGKHFVSGSVDRTLKVWSLANLGEVATFTGHEDTVNWVLMDEKFIVSGSLDKTLTVWPSVENQEGEVCLPESSDSINAAFQFNYNKSEPAPYGNSLIRSCLGVVKQGLPIHPYLQSYCIMPLKLNILHVYAYFHCTQALTAALKNKVPVIRGYFGSPLTVALNRKSLSCVDTILRHLIMMCDSDPSGAELQLYSITEDLGKVLLSNSPQLISFFMRLLHLSTQSRLPHFLSPMQALPMYRFETSRYITISRFSKQRDQGQAVEFWVSLIHFNFTVGSTPSLLFLEALDNCQQQKVFTTPLIAAVLESKWQTLFPLTLAKTGLYILLLINVIALTFSKWRPDVLCGVFISLNGIFLCFELLQMLGTGVSYLTTFWNYIDLVRLSLSLIWAILLLEDTDLQYLCLAVVIFNFLRGFTYFRTFKLTRIFVRMTLEVMKNVYAFLAILAYSVFAFGIMAAVLDQNISTVYDSWTNEYNILMGNGDTSAYGLGQWFVFTAATIINVIIMLNLLVSILSNAFNKAEQSSAENDAREMLQVIIEWETLFTWRRKRGSPSVLVKCCSIDKTDKQDELLNTLREKVRTVGGRLGTVEMKIGNLEQKLGRLEGGINSKLDIIFSKLTP